MLGIPLRYLLKHPVQVVGELAADPAQTWMNLQDEYTAARERQRPLFPYHPDIHWEQRLHAALGVPWPCPATAEFWALWPTVMAELEARGITPGPMSLEHWNDGDAGFVRAVWCMVRHRRPRKIVETGVAHGVTTRFVLEALDRNDDGGRLWSIDLPNLNRELRRNIGAAVGGPLDNRRARWTLIEGSSRRHLPALLSSLDSIDLFIHDSLHSERNVRFELEHAWEAIRSGCAIVVDDIDANWGFENFTRSTPGLQSFIAEAEPVRPDFRRFNHKGLFGVLLKEPRV